MSSETKQLLSVRSFKAEFSSKIRFKFCLSVLLNDFRRLNVILTYLCHIFLFCPFWRMATHGHCKPLYEKYIHEDFTKFSFRHF